MKIVPMTWVIVQMQLMYIYYLESKSRQKSAMLGLKLKGNVNIKCQTYNKIITVNRLNNHHMAMALANDS